jgi:hypothetical protein
VGAAKSIVVKPISAADGNRIIRALHYSGKVVQNSQLHLGVFLNGRCHGAMQFGPPMDRSKLLGLVAGSRWSDMVELNRMAFSERLPRNSESRAIAIAMRMLRRHAPHVKWVVSFADATQCGDGAIYRASGFVLTGIKRTANLARLPDGSVVHKMAIENRMARPRPELGGRSCADVTGGRYDFGAYCRAARATRLQGHQLRYLYFLDPACAARLTVPVIPFSALREHGIGMYRGRPTVAKDHACARAAGAVTPSPQGVRTDPHAPG